MGFNRTEVAVRCDEFDQVVQLVRKSAPELTNLQLMQEGLDDEFWEVSSSGEAKRRHIGFHLTIAAAKLARVEERHDHGVFDDDVVDDVAADLVIYALQLANLRGRPLPELLEERLGEVFTRTMAHQTP